MRRIFFVVIGLISGAALLLSVLPAAAQGTVSAESDSEAQPIKLIDDSFYNAINNPAYETPVFSQGESYLSNFGPERDSDTLNLTPFDPLNINQEIEQRRAASELGQLQQQSTEEAAETLTGKTTCGPEGNGYRLCVPIPGFPLFLENSLAGYVATIYSFALAIGGLLVFIMVVWGGITYALSAGNTALLTDARDRIFQAIAGLLLLLLSYIILNTVNPDILSLREPSLENINIPEVREAREKEARRQFLQTNREAAANKRLSLEELQAQLETDPDNKELRQKALATEFDALSSEQKEVLSRLGTVNNEILKLEKEYEGFWNVLGNRTGNFFSGEGWRALTLNERQRLDELKQKQTQLKTESDAKLRRMEEIRKLQEQ